MKYQKCHLKSGDFVYIQSGDNRGKTGKILSMNKKKSKALVTIQGDLAKTIFVDLSNLFYYDFALSKFARIGYRIINNKKERYLKVRKSINK